MAEPQGTPESQTQEPQTPAPQTPAPTLTQEQVNAIAAKEKAEGRQAAMNEVVTKLGGITIEEAAKLVTEARERDEAQKTEAQKAKDAADRAKAEAEAAAAVAAAETHKAKLMQALIAGGVKPERMDHAMKLVDCEVGAADDVIKGAVEKAKTDLPEFFGAGQAPQQPASPPAPGSDPPGAPPATKPNEDKYQKGLERAKASGPRGEYAFTGLNKGGNA